MRLQVLEGALFGRWLMFAATVSAALLAALVARAQNFDRPRFRDVPRGHWAWEAVSRISSAGFVEGLPNDTYDGDRPMTRYEFVTATARLAERMPLYSASGQAQEQVRGKVLTRGDAKLSQEAFLEVARGHWSYDALTRLSHLGFVEGFSDGTFRGSRAVRRFDCAVVLARLSLRVDASYDEAEGSRRLQTLSEQADAEQKIEPFPDVSKSHWAAHSIRKVWRRDLIRGFPDGRFHGTRSLSRYQFAVIMARLLDRQPPVYGPR